MESYETLIRIFQDIRPNVVINCIGIVKQLSDAQDPIKVIPINSILPHRLAQLCSFTDSRLIHISTDCVFSGKRGMYSEEDIPDPIDLYGKSKLLGEIESLKYVITLRTSIIGKEINTENGLLNWFLSQNPQVNRVAPIFGLCQSKTR